MSTFVCIVGALDEERWFCSFEAAERWARKRVRQLDGRGFSRPISIERHEHGFTVDLATVHLDGADRVWTDMR